jgi:hypothetical protein
LLKPDENEGLILFSNAIGDEVGTIKVLEIYKPSEQL